MIDQIVKDMHIHRPKIRQLMTFTDKEGKRQSHLLNPGDAAAAALIIRTLKWAAHNGIVVTFRPA